LKTIPAGKNWRRASAPQLGQAAFGSSDIFCHTSNSVEQAGQR
jgi:hypothetical protein